MTGTMRKALTLIAIAGLVSACSGQGGSAATNVTATLKEWEIKLASTDLKAGDIQINFTNNGDKEHEFLVRKTDLAPDKLPLLTSGEDKGRVDEESSQLTEVGNPSEIAVIPPGTTGLSLRLTLQPGHYVVFCNLHVGDLLHYKKGMHAEFTVS
jgi:plastocyanin